MPGILLRIFYNLPHEPHKYKGGSQKPRFTTWPDFPDNRFLYWILYSKWANDNAFPGKSIFLSLLFLLHSVSWTEEIKTRDFFFCGLEDWETGKSNCSEKYTINLQKEAKMKDGKSFWFLTVLQTMGSYQRPSYICPRFGIHYISLKLKDKYSYLVKLV